MSPPGQRSLFEDRLPSTAVFRISTSRSSSNSADFRWDGKTTSVLATTVDVDGQHRDGPTFVNEFWTSRQRAAHSPSRSLVSRLLQAAAPAVLHRTSDASRATSSTTRSWDAARRCSRPPCSGRVPVGCDINPLSRMLVEPRLRPPSLEAVRAASVERRLDGERGTPGRPADVLSPGHAARDLRAEGVPASKAASAGRSMRSTDGFAWSRSTG